MPHAARLLPRRVAVESRGVTRLDLSGGRAGGRFREQPPALRLVAFRVSIHRPSKPIPRAVDRAVVPTDRVARLRFPGGLV